MKEAQKPVYFEEMDYLDYVTEDTVMVSDRITPSLDILYDADENLIGARIYGLKAALESAGLVIVPIEPTEAMLLGLAAGNQYWVPKSHQRFVYRAMITASTEQNK